MLRAVKTYMHNSATVYVENIQSALLDHILIHLREAHIKTGTSMQSQGKEMQSKDDYLLHSKY